jgi:hypothetical protein
MGNVIDFRAHTPDLRVLARIVDAESDRLCAIIDTAHSYQIREQALSELKHLAENVLIVLESVQPEPAELEVAA